MASRLGRALTPLPHWCTTLRGSRPASNSKITKLQQIGRGLRLAVNQQLERVQADDPAFDDVNQLIVVVPASEGDFVGAIQSEIAAHSVRLVSRVINQESLVQ